MKTKKEFMDTLCLQLQQIVNLRSQIEEKPIQFDTDIILSPKEIHTIQAIGELGTLNIKQLGDHFGVTKSAASQMIAKLTEKGFVTKQESPHNNKELLLALTTLGDRAFAVHEKFHAQHREKLFKELKKFSSDDIETTTQLLQVVKKAMQQRASEK